MNHIFVSYSHLDADFAQNLRNKLEVAGIPIWLDDDRLEAGDDWRQGIDDAIKTSGALILIITPDALASPYVTYEWSFAYGLGIPIVPLLHKKATLHPRLESWHYHDFTHRINRPWDALISQIQTLTG